MLLAAWGRTAGFMETIDEGSEEKGVQVTALSQSDKTHGGIFSFNIVFCPAFFPATKKN